MLSGQCFKEGCTNRLYWKCECEGIVLICKIHLSSHVKKPTSKGHQYQKISLKPAEEIRQPLINKLKELKVNIKKYRIEAIMNANEVIKNFKTEFGKYIDQIKKVEARCNKMLKVLYSREKVLDITNDDDIESLLKCNASNAQSMMARLNLNDCYLDYKDINAAISKIYEEPFNPFRQLVENIIKSNELSFFRHCTSNFSTINLDTFQVSSTLDLPTQESIHGYMASCILPDYTYFYCCNPNGKSGLTFIIDKNKNIKQLQNSKVNYYAEPIFYKNFIYLIGGTNNFAERYDFKKDLWESMTPPPQGLNFHCSCNALYRDLILITSYSMQKMIIYRISQNSYQEIPNLVLNINFIKYMLIANNRVYLFEKGGRVFESAENNILIWDQIGNNSITRDLNQSSVVRYKGSLYFVIYPNQLWKFDLSSKQASQVATL